MLFVQVILPVSLSSLPATCSNAACSSTCAPDRQLPVPLYAGIGCCPRCLRHELATAQLGRFVLFMLAYTAAMAGVALLLARGCGCAGDATEPWCCPPR